MKNWLWTQVADKIHLLDQHLLKMMFQNLVIKSPDLCKLPNLYESNIFCIGRRVVFIKLKDNKIVSGFKQNNIFV
jgi:hypothetical protein